MAVSTSIAKTIEGLSLFSQSATSFISPWMWRGNAITIPILCGPLKSLLSHIYPEASACALEAMCFVPKNNKFVTHSNYDILKQVCRFLHSSYLCSNLLECQVSICASLACALLLSLNRESAGKPDQKPLRNVLQFRILHLLAAQGILH